MVLVIRAVTASAASVWAACLLAIRTGHARRHGEVYMLALAAAAAASAAAVALRAAYPSRAAFRAGFAAGEREGRKRPLGRVPVVYLPDRRARGERVEQDRRN